MELDTKCRIQRNTKWKRQSTQDTESGEGCSVYRKEILRKMPSPGSFNDVMMKIQAHEDAFV